MEDLEMNLSTTTPKAASGATPKRAPTRWGDILKELARPTPQEAIKTREQGGTTLSYVDARYVYELLDEVVGADNWQTGLQWSPPIWTPAVTTRDGKVLEPEMTQPYPVGGIGIRNPETDEWVWRWDVGDYSNISFVKGGVSDSLKRAAVQFGIARDLYSGRGPATEVQGWSCPDHNQAKLIPAGFSKRTGKKYPAFVVCPVDGCDKKRPSDGATASGRS